MRVQGRERIDNREAIARHGEGGRGRARESIFSSLITISQWLQIQCTQSLLLPLSAVAISRCV